MYYLKKATYYKQLKKVAFIVCFISSFNAYSQCFQVYDGFGVIQNTPYFIGCNGADYTIFLQTDVAIGNYTIDWGDGTPNSSGASLVPPAYITHTYSQTVDTFNITVTETGTGCTVSGVVVLEEPVNASIQIPLGGVTVVCAPSPITFVNSSTNVSPTTQFTWDFGDGTPPLVFDASNSGQPVTHTYQKNTVSCETVVTLTAENYCSFGNPTIANFSPLMVYDVDTAIITASATTLCYPDTVVHFTNTTQKNCLPEGNVQQRYEYWNLGDYWGLGYDSIIPWLPFDPPARPGHTIAFPGIGTYSIMMIDSNMCGQDTAYITITIIPPPTAGMVSNVDSACVGELVTINNNSSGGANQFFWDFDDGNGFVQLPGNQSFSFADTGLTTVTMIASISGTSGVCQDTTQTDIYINPSPVAQFTLDNYQGCDSITVNISDSTSGAVAWQWNLGGGNTSNLPNPPTQTYTTPGNHYISLVVTHANGCSDVAQANAKVFRVPQANFAAQSVCQFADASFIDLSLDWGNGNNNINSWSWDFGDGNNSNQQNPTNVYSATGTYPVTLIVSTPKCSDTIVDSVVVQQKPTAAFELSDSTGCSPLNIITTNNSIGASSYFWDFGNGAVSNGITPTNTYYNTDTLDTNFTVELIVGTTSGCYDTAQIPITVFGGPLAGFTHNNTPDCGPVSVDFTNTSNGAVTYLWDFDDSTANSNLVNPNHIFNNTSQFISHYQVALIAANVTGCTDTAIVPVTVYPEPIFPFSMIPDSGCSPLTVGFPAIVGAVSYQWDFGDGASANGQAPSHTYYNNTTNDQMFQVQLIATSSFGCMDTTNETVTVFPEPVANFAVVDTAGCGPLNVQFSNNSLNTTYYMWSFGDGDTSSSAAPNVPHTYTNNTYVLQNYLAQLITTTPHGCADTSYQNITVYPKVLAEFDMDSVGCAPVNAAFNNTSLGANAYAWNFGDGSISNNAQPTHVYTTNLNNDTVYYATLIANSSFGCADTTSDSITLFHSPTASLIANSVTGCAPVLVEFTNLSTGYDSIFIQFGDGTTTANDTASYFHTFLNSTGVAQNISPQVVVSTVNGCTDQASLNYTVYPEVSASFELDSAGCTPLPGNIVNTSQGLSTYLWSFGDGTNSNIFQPVHSFLSPQNSDTLYYVTLIGTSSFGCSDTAMDSINVYHTPTAVLTSNVTSGCTPANVVFYNNSFAYDSLFFSYGDGNVTTLNQAQFPYQFVNNLSSIQQLVPELIVETIHGCRDTATSSFSVFPPVEANFSGDTVGCSPFTTNFQNSSHGAATYLWNFGNGTISNLISPNATFTASGQTQSYEVILEATSSHGCTDYDTLDITVRPSATAAFSVGALAGCSPLAVGFNNNSADYNTLVWSFGDGSSSSSTASTVNHTYVNPATTSTFYTISLLATTNYGCNDTANAQVEVYPEILANAGPDELGCSPLPVQFTNTSTGASSYVWDLGNGNISTVSAPQETYTNSTTSVQYFQSVLTATSAYGCTAKDTAEVTVYPEPVASFFATPTIQTFPMSVVTVTNTTTGNWNYSWSFGDGTISTLMNPAPYDYNAPGDYSIELIISNNYCADSVSQVVSIIPPPPVSDFSGEGAGCSPVTVSFTNTSLYGASYLWDFGDGNTSTQENPIYTYFLPGSYDVSLTVSGVSGTDTKTLVGAVNVYPNAVANFDYQPIQVSTVGDKTFFYNQSANANTYLWNFGNGDTSTEVNPIYQYTSVGDFPITLIANNDFNCPDTVTHSTFISVQAQGDVSFPNAFVPNANGPSGGYYQDGIIDNSIFHPISIGVAEYHLIIYNRWGELVFETFDVNQGWDGYYKNQIAPQDAYVWKADVVLVNGEKQIYSGDVTLLR